MKFVQQFQINKAVFTKATEIAKRIDESVAGKPVRAVRERISIPGFMKAQVIQSPLEEGLVIELTAEYDEGFVLRALGGVYKIADGVMDLVDLRNEVMAKEAEYDDSDIADDGVEFAPVYRRAS